MDEFRTPRPCNKQGLQDDYGPCKRGRSIVIPRAGAMPRFYFCRRHRALWQYEIIRTF